MTIRKYYIEPIHLPTIFFSSESNNLKRSNKAIDIYGNKQFNMNILGKFC